MESKRFPRFRRATIVVPILLTHRDRAIIRLVHRHRFLRSSHIAALLGKSAQPILRRLQLLYHHGYLERPGAQLDYYHLSGSRPIVYGLGDKGAALLRRELGLEPEKPRWSEKNRSVGRIFLEHALFVSDFMVAIELACRKAGEVRLVDRSELPIPDAGERKRRSFRWQVPLGQGLRLGVIPDRVFALENTNEAGNHDLRFFFLEADRGTMPVKRQNLSLTSMYRKLLAYQATWAQGVHRTRFGFHRFRVLILTTSAERVKSLLETCSELKSGHGLFLFADRRILDRREDILSAKWQTGRPGESGTLLD